MIVPLLECLLIKLNSIGTQIISIVKTELIKFIRTEKTHFIHSTIRNYIQMLIDFEKI